MRPAAHLAELALLSIVLVACGSTPTPGGSPSPSMSPGVSPVPSVEVPPGGEPSPTPSPTGEPTPAPTPAPTSSPSGTPVPPPAGSDPWTGLTWEGLDRRDPVARSTTVIAWSGGYVALGDRLADRDGIHSRVWTSADGRTWAELPADTFGSTALVVSLAPIGDGVTALALEVASSSCGEGSPRLGCLDLAGPLTTWTSADGVAWVRHDGPAVALPDGMSGQDDEHPVFEPGLRDVLIVRGEDAWQARSGDGATWTLPGTDVPDGWRPVAASRLGDTLVALGRVDGRAVVLTSTDGTGWASLDLPAGCGNPDALVAAEHGLLVAGSRAGAGGATSVRWCSSPDGVAWATVDGYPPLGAWTGADECRGVCPAGLVAGDGTRMVAFRGHGRAAAWSSADGTTWNRLALTGTGPEGFRDWGYPYSLQVLPFGIVLRNGLTGDAWVGRAGA